MSELIVYTGTQGHARGRRGVQLAESITWQASKQTYGTVRFLVDRDRVADAYRAYAYFRWVDDRLDSDELSASDRLAFVSSQQALVEHVLRGGVNAAALCPEEQLLADLLRGSRAEDAGLRAYVVNMMAVMAFDAERRGRLITEAELATYTRWLATAVTEALHYFIGHDCYTPRGQMRILAVTGAHITHMLRDTLEDIASGYINLPAEVVAAGVDPADVNAPAYRAWVRQRVDLARNCFFAGRAYLEQVESLRCRLAGYAYTARFETVLDAIERDGYRLRADYPERKTPAAALRMGWAALRQSARHPQVLQPAPRMPLAES